MRNGVVTALAVAAAFSATSVQAHHHSRHDDGDQLAYVLGGAVVGAAIGGLIYDNRYDHGHYRYRSTHYYPRRYRYKRHNGYGRYYGRYYDRHYRRYGYKRHYDRHYYPRRHYRRYRHHH